MSHDLGRLAVTGRAYSGFRAWTPEELDALITLENERGLLRQNAADYIRNGIMTLEDYDAAAKAKFVPQTIEGARLAAEAALKDHKFVSKAPVVKKAPKKPSTKKPKKTP